MGEYPLIRTYTPGDAILSIRYFPTADRFSKENLSLGKILFVLYIAGIPVRTRTDRIYISAFYYIRLGFTEFHFSSLLAIILYDFQIFQFLFSIKV